VNDADNTRDQGLTTEQIASARPGPAQPAEQAAPAGQYEAGQYDAPPAGQDDYDAAPAGQSDAGQYAAAPAGRDDYADDRSAPRDAGFAASGDTRGDVPQAAPGGGTATGPGRHASLLDDSELQNITMRWKDIQAEFVDEPSKAVQEADALVAELMQRLAQMFANERAELEGRWAGGSQVGTEELRQGLRLYRSFFERLLAA
jgi:hypothetical protein